MMMLSTYQTKSAYDDALARHAQYVRWMKAFPCTCTSADTQQPDPRCVLCRGRGLQYTAPANSQIYEELTSCDFVGVLTLQLPCKPNTAVVKNLATGKQLTVVSQPDSTTLILAAPYPKPYEYVVISYTTQFKITTLLDTYVVIRSYAIATQAYVVLRPNSAILHKGGHDYEGTIIGVPTIVDRWLAPIAPAVINRIDRELITIEVDVAGVDPLDGLPRYEITTVDVIMPFRFLVHSISEKVRWESGYVQEGADAIVVVPSYIKCAISDLFTILSAEQVGATVLEPKGNTVTDVIRNYYDISKILEIRDALGQELDPADVIIFNRNELLWLANKPNGRYMVQFLYHPTFSVIPSLPTLRNAEDKQFVNRLNVVEYTRLTGKTTF